MKHTPGPWTIRQTYRYVYHESHGDDGEHEMGFSLSAPSLWVGGDPEIAALHEAESEANARLIAAAPELLAALAFYADENAWLKVTVDAYLVDASIFDWPGDLGDEPWDIARAAIAKAEGE